MYAIYLSICVCVLCVLCVCVVCVVCVVCGCMVLCIGCFMFIGIVDFSTKQRQFLGAQHNFTHHKSHSPQINTQNSSTTSNLLGGSTVLAWVWHRARAFPFFFNFHTNDDYVLVCFWTVYLERAVDVCRWHYVFHAMSPRPSDVFVKSTAHQWQCFLAWFSLFS